MKRVFKKSFFENVIKILFVVFLAKLFSLAVYIYLPKTDPQSVKSDIKDIPYGYVNFKNMLTASASTSSDTNDHTQSNTNLSGIDEFVLKALYGNSKKGFVVIANKSTPNKTNIVELNKTFQGYKLVNIKIDSAVFEKNGKKYILFLDKSDKTEKNFKNTHNYQTSAPEILDNVTVTRKDINYYKHHPDDIWKNISIKEVRKGDGIYGFKVLYVKQTSPFAKLGLKKGDIIIRANNKRLNSLKTVFEIYKHIDTLDSIDLVILRNGVQKEIFYEID